jgi:hypothetical protein
MNKLISSFALLIIVHSTPLLAMEESTDITFNPDEHRLKTIMKLEEKYKNSNQNCLLPIFTDLHNFRTNLKEQKPIKEYELLSQITACENDILDYFITFENVAGISDKTEELIQEFQNIKQKYYSKFFSNPEPQVPMEVLITTDASPDENKN